MPRVGFSGLRYALLTADTSSALTYGEPVLMPQAIELKITRNSQTAKNYADDGVAAVSFSAGESDVELTIGKFDIDLRAALTGRTVTAGRMDVTGAEPPYVALGWIATKDDGKKEWHWLFKGKFSQPDDNYKTKGENVEFQNYTLKGSFANTEKTGKSEAIMDESSSSYVADSGATFIATVPTT